MASYRVLIKRSAASELEEGPRKDRERLVARIAKLSAEPRPPGSDKLSGQPLYRIRQGAYRVVYEIDDDAIVVLVIRVAHRRDVYRR